MDKGGLRPNSDDWIGVPLARFEDERLVRGAGCFVDDLSLPGCLFLDFVRSSHAGGRITALDWSRAARAPGVTAVLRGSDLAHVGAPPVNPLIADIRLPDFSALACSRVGATGQPVAAIVAESLLQARDAAQLVTVDVDAEIAAGTKQEAFAKIWQSGDVAAAFAQADHVVSAEIAHPRVVPMALEARATLAHWKADEHRLTVFMSTQTPHRARSDLARMLGLAEAQVRVVARDVGGAFGGKASIYPEDAIVAFAAMHTGRPVKWCATRSEDMLSATHGRGARSRGELALSTDGRLLALRAEFDFPIGFWLPFSAAAPANNAGRILPGPYRIEAVDIRARGTSGNTAPVNIYRGAGRPEAAMLMERLLDEAARSLERDPAELRAVNLIERDAFPYRTPTGSLLDSGDYPALLHETLALSDYERLKRQRDGRRLLGEICGVGLALYIEPCGQGWESASVELRQDGIIAVATGSSAQGQGRTTTFAQIAADALLLSPQEIDVRHGDTQTAPPGIGALASRSTAIGGSALLVACEKFRDQAREIAARLMQLPKDCVAAVPGGFAEADGGLQITWRQIARSLAADSGIPADAAALKVSNVFHAEGEAWSSGCCIATVGIDADTGALTVERIDWVDDAGVVINPRLAKGQLIGGLAQGVGEALLEEVIYDGEGQLLTGSLSDYAVPRAIHIPPVRLASIETPSPANALGAKGVGEAGCIGIPAAIVNAAVDALSPFGIRHLDMPLTSAKLWQAMDQSKAKKQTKE